MKKVSAFYPSLLLIMTSCRETIVHDVEESTANRIALVLAQAAIQSEKVQAGSLWNVVVSDDQVTEALATIEEQRVLKPSLTSALSSAGSGFIQTREERLRGIERDRASTLEATLERLPGVREARVHLIFAPENVLALAPKQKRDSASVLIIYGATETVNEEQVKRLVSGGTGIEVAAISVVITEQPKQLPEGKRRLPFTTVAPAKNRKQAKLGSTSTMLLTIVGGGAVLGLGFFTMVSYCGRKRKDESGDPITPVVESTMPSEDRTTLEDAF